MIKMIGSFVDYLLRICLPGEMLINMNPKVLHTGRIRQRSIACLRMYSLSESLLHLEKITAVLLAVLVVDPSLE